MGTACRDLADALIADGESRSTFGPMADAPKPSPLAGEGLKGRASNVDPS
jgi:hypothetical protein